MHHFKCPNSARASRLQQESDQTQAGGIQLLWFESALMKRHNKKPLMLMIQAATGVSSCHPQKSCTLHSVPCSVGCKTPFLGS